MYPLEDCDKYTIRPGTTNNGVTYEKKVVLFCYFLNGFNDEVNDFRIMSNVQGLESFDDVVLQIEWKGSSNDNLDTQQTNWTTIVMQLKYKENLLNGIEPGMLKTDKGFRLDKPYDSFCKIMESETNPIGENIEISTFVIYTNAANNKNMAEVPMKEVPDFILDTSELKQGTELPCVFQLLPDEKLESPYQHIMKNEAARSDFFDKLLICTSQASDIAALALRAIREHYPDQSSISSSELLSESQKMIEEYLSGAAIITKGMFRRNLAWLVVKQLHAKNMPKHSEEHQFFNRDVTLRAKDPVNVIHILYNQSFELLKLKAINSLNNSENDHLWFYLEVKQIEKYKKDVRNLFLEKRAEETKEKKNEKPITLVVECENSNEESPTAWKLLEQIYEENKSVTIIVLVSSLEHSKHVQGGNVTYQTTKVKSTFSELQPHIQELLLNKSVSFQGKTVKLGDLLPQVVENIDEKTIWKLWRKEVRFGSSLPDANPNLCARALRLEKHKLKSASSSIRSKNTMDAFVISENSMYSFCRQGSKKKFQRTAVVHGNAYIKRDENVFLVNGEPSTKLIKRIVDVEKYDSVHCFTESTAGELILHKSYNAELDHNFLEYEPKKISNVQCMSDIRHRFILIAGEPGAGKTTLFKYWAQTMKDKNKQALVVLVHLNDCSRSLESMSFDSLQDVYQLVQLQLGEHLPSSFVEEYLQTEGKCVVLLDGLDEIFPKFFDKLEKIIALLLEETKVQKLCVSTRKSLSFIQKNQHFTLQGLTEGEQKQYLSTYWKRKFGETRVIDEYIDMLLSRIKEHPLGAVDPKLLQTPLILEMVAKAFTDTLAKYIEEPKFQMPIHNQLNLFLLFQYFTTNQLLWEWVEKLGLDSSRASVDSEKEKQLEYGRNMNMKAALLYYSPQVEFITEVERQEVLAAINNRQLKSVIVSVNSNGRPNYTHQMFAEYYFALWLKENHKRHRAELQKFFFREEHKTTRYFFDLMLCAAHPLHTSLITNGSVDHYHDHDPMQKDGGGRNILHLALCYAKDLDLQNLLHQYSSLLVEPDDVLNWVPLQYIYVLENWRMLEEVLASRRTPELSILLESFEQKVITQKSAWDGLVTVLKNDFSHVFPLLTKNCSALGIFEERNNKKYAKKNFRVGWKIKEYLGYGTSAELLNIASYYGAVNILETMSDTYSHHNLSEALFYAVSGENSKAVSFLLQNGANANYRFECTIKKANTVERYEVTPLFLAIQKGDHNLLSILLNAEADPYTFCVCKNVSKSLLDVAVEENRHIILQNILRKHKSDSRLFEYLGISKFGYPQGHVALASLAQHRGSCGRTILHAACTENNTVLMLYALLIGVDVNSADDNGDTALHLTSDPQMVKILISKEANINAKNKRNYTPLHDAVENCNLLKVKELLDNRTEVNSVGPNGNTPLHLKSSFDVVTLLLVRGADVHARNSDRETPLHTSTRHGEVECVDAILLRHPDVNAINKQGSVPLHMVEDKRVCESLIRHKANVNMVNRLGQTPLHEAVIRNKTEVCLGLISAGADVNKTDVNGATPLCSVRDKRIATMLIDAKANVNIGPKFLSPLHYAVQNNHLETAEVLLDNGADFTAADLFDSAPLPVQMSEEMVSFLLGVIRNRSKTPLHHAVQTNVAHMVEDILTEQHDVNVTDGTGKTPLFFVKDRKIAEYLIREGAIVGHQDHDQKTPLHSAVQQNLLEVAEVLLLNGADLESKDGTGKTPLFFARTQKMASKLIKHRANVNATDNKRQTPLHLAVRNDLKEVWRLLIKGGADLSATDDCGYTPFDTIVGID